MLFWATRFYQQFFLMFSIENFIKKGLSKHLCKAFPTLECLKTLKNPYFDSHMNIFEVMPFTRVCSGFVGASSQEDGVGVKEDCDAVQLDRHHSWIS